MKGSSRSLMPDLAGTSPNLLRAQPSLLPFRITALSVAPRSPHVACRSSRRWNRPRRCEPGLGRWGSSRRFSTARNVEPIEAPSFAFAFDIDGVLLHVAEPIPGASETLRYLHDHDIPFILLTNGGGKHETERVRDLSAKLGVPLTTDNFVQSHTPFRQLVDGPDGLRDKTILVTGSNAQKCREIAEQYGFRNVVIPADILTAHPTIWPFEPLAETLYARTARPLPKPVFTPGSGHALADSLKIDAMFVFHDPRDWALDLQLIMDLLLSREGHLGTYSTRNGDAALPGCGWQRDGQPPLYFSNGDVFWSTGYHLPRFGQGAFQAAVAGVWRRVTDGHELQRRVLGKPTAETYRFAERMLQAHRHEVLRRFHQRNEATSSKSSTDSTGGTGISNKSNKSNKSNGVAPEQAQLQTHAASPALDAVYMVGDNPESDIAGANDFRDSGGSEVGARWRSVLVRTGVWSPDRGGEAALRGRFQPEAVVADVRDAVRWALQEEKWRGEPLR